MSLLVTVALGFAPFTLLGLGALIRSALARHRLRARLRARRAAGPALPPAFLTPARALDAEWDRDPGCLDDCADALRSGTCNHRRP